MITHPYGPARRVPLLQAIEQLRTAGAPRQVALVLAATGMAATGLDLTAIDTDQLRGQLRVGAWAVNYFGPNYQAALTIAGRPAGLAAATLPRQAQVAVAVWRAYGLDYWPEFRSGAWRGALSAGQLRSAPVTLDGRPPPAAIEAAGQAAGVRLGAQVRTTLPAMQRLTASADQLRSTIRQAGNGGL